MNKGEIRFVVVGKTGNGKSAACNSIARRQQLFKQTASTTSTTKKCQFETISFNGRSLLVVDTPGLYDTELKQEDTLKEIGKVMAITSPGFHAFVIVVSVGRFTAEEKDTVDLLAEKFGPELYERSVILFTRVDDLTADNRLFEEYLKETKPPALGTIIEKCGGRCVGFNNRLEGPVLEEQVSCLVQCIEGIIRAKENKCYTNEIYEAVEARLKEERHKRLQSKQKKSEAQVTDEMRHEVENETTEFGRGFLGWFRRLPKCTIL